MDPAELGRLMRLRSRANASARSMRDRGTARAARDTAGDEWAKSRLEAEMLASGKKPLPRNGKPENAPSENTKKTAKPKGKGIFAEPEGWKVASAKRRETMKNVPSKARNPEKTTMKRKANVVKTPPKKSDPASPPLERDALAGEINRAYASLASAGRDLARAKYVLEAHERRTRIENADALLEAKNLRAMDMYLEGIMDTEEHRNLVKEKTRAELAHSEAKADVERLKLLVSLVGVSTSGQ